MTKKKDGRNKPNKRALKDINEKDVLGLAERFWTKSEIAAFLNWESWGGGRRCEDRVCGLTKRTIRRTLRDEWRSNMANPVTASEARANLYRLIDETNASHRPVVISGKRSSAVLVAAEDWDAIQETLYLLSIPGMRESIKKGMAEPLEKSARALKW